MTEVQQQTAALVTENDDVKLLREDLKEDLKSTARWRERKATEYQNDARNQRAVLLINRLIPTVDDVPAALLLRWGATLDNQSTDEPWDTFRAALAFKFSPGSCVELLLAFCIEPSRFVVQWKCQ